MGGKMKYIKTKELPPSLNYIKECTTCNTKFEFYMTEVFHTKYFYGEKYLIRECPVCGVKRWMKLMLIKEIQ